MMHNPSTYFRRVIGAVCVALIASCLAPGAGAAEARGTTVPLVGAAGDTFVIIPATREVQLLKGPGVKTSHSAAKAGTSQWVGKKPHGKPVVSRLFYSFDLSGLPADAITEVTLEHVQIYSPNRTCYLNSYGPAVKVVTTGAPASKPRWPGPAATSTSVASGFALGRRQACVANRIQTWNVTEMVRSAAMKSSTVHLRLASANEKKTSGYRKYDIQSSSAPSLRVFLRPHPDKPTHLTVDLLAPKSPAVPMTVSSATTGIRAELTTPGGCRGTTVLFTCLAARYELADSDGTIVSSGLNTSLFESDGVGHLNQAVGPMVEGVDYVARVWGVNTQTGLESIEPARVTIRYNAPPGAPTVSSPGDWQMGKAIQVTATAHDADAAEVCWEIQTGEGVWEDCSDIEADQPTVITLGTLDGLAMLSGSLWVVDEYGIRGPGAPIDGAVHW